MVHQLLYNFKSHFTLERGDSASKDEGDDLSEQRKSSRSVRIIDPKRNPMSVLVLLVRNDTTSNTKRIERSPRHNIQTSAQAGNLATLVALNLQTQTKTIFLPLKKEKMVFEKHTLLEFFSPFSHQFFFV